MTMTKDEATANLHKAIQDHSQAFDLHKDDELLSEFAIISCWTNYESGGRTYYTTHYHSSNVPLHVSLGLFATAMVIAEDQSNAEE